MACDLMVMCLILQTLDAAIYTLEQKIDAEGQNSELKDQVIKVHGKMRHKKCNCVLLVGLNVYHFVMNVAAKVLRCSTG